MNPSSLAPSKIQQILAAGEKQLSPEEFDELTNLIFDLQVYGLTPWINAELGKLMAKISWELEVGESPEWTEALQACDRAFLGRELRDMCLDVGASPVGHKKELCARLYKRKVPEVLSVMEPYLKEMTPEEIKKEVERYALVERLPQTEPLYELKLSTIKDRLEKLRRRVDPGEFLRRMEQIADAIKDREAGKPTMPDLTLDDLRELLDFANRIYRQEV